MPTPIYSVLSVFIHDDATALGHVGMPVAAVDRTHESERPGGVHDEAEFARHRRVMPEVHRWSERSVVSVHPSRPAHSGAISRPPTGAGGIFRSPSGASAVLSRAGTIRTTVGTVVTAPRTDWTTAPGSLSSSTGLAPQVLVAEDEETVVRIRGFGRVMQGFEGRSPRNGDGLFVAPCSFLRTRDVPTDRSGECVDSRIRFDVKEGETQFVARRQR